MDGSTVVEHVEILNGRKCVMGNVSVDQYNAMVSVHQGEVSVAMISVSFL